MVQYSSAYTQKEMKEDMDAEGGSMKEHKSTLLNDHDKVIEHILNMSNKDFHHFKKTIKLIHHCLPHIHKSDEEVGEIAINHMQDEGGSFISKIGHALSSAGKGIVHGIKKGISYIGNKIKNKVKSTVHMITHPTPEQLIKLTARGLISYAVPGGFAVKSIMGPVSDAAIHKIMGGSFSDMEKAQHQHHLANMIHNDRKIMMQTGESDKVSHFLHAFHMAHELHKDL